MNFAPVGFEALPDWAATDVGAARRAFVRSCALMQRRPADAPLSEIATYPGLVGDWAAACAAAGDEALADRAFWTAHFDAWSVTTATTDTGRLTSYYEPVMQARRTRDALHSEPIQAPPPDLLEADLGAFDPNLAGRKIVGRVAGGAFVPYRTRAEVRPETAPVLAWGEPGEVMSLQIQGSGRLVFEDGAQVRAAFAATNGRPFRSVAQELIRRGELPANGASMDAIKAWLRAADPAKARDVMNANPRTVFFALETIPDPGVGPRGSQGLPLEPGGSAAVDPVYHAYGTPFFLAAGAPRVTATIDPTLRRLLIAQDSGGAILGPIRADLYWGTGPEAAMRAGRVNHDLRWWVLLPKGMDPTRPRPRP
jgi:membrane-bound lytic murein transglycosylase A